MPQVEHKTQIIKTILDKALTCPLLDFVIRVPLMAVQATSAAEGWTAKTLGTSMSKVVDIA
jgi:hypothetical protein